MAEGFNKSHLLGIEELSAAEINFILKTAEAMKEISFREIKKVPTLRGKTIITFFMNQAPAPALPLKLPLSV